MQITSTENNALAQTKPQTNQKAVADFSEALKSADKAQTQASMTPPPSSLFSSQSMSLLHQDEINFFNRSFTDAYNRPQGGFNAVAGGSQLAMQV